jgi:hypothetical protein
MVFVSRSILKQRLRMPARVLSPTNNIYSFSFGDLSINLTNKKRLSIHPTYESSGIEGVWNMVREN